ncbi:GAF domain-containing protein [Actinobacteria bacterium YIM 96077]|uniref:Sensor histidine kinase n=1 Tax=Phytoactinopolyspora halophila TaxID=1981511 RepID=A0A329QAQ7_9ACTN|nr:histidine kinase [Phytoactinopolyspora halophila]AYY12486.1 GAF domain-containing protein [Actinobacteria bacterium YIM 96077]RAW09317.1 sensor histidine kinase [Phytoactinopolyspora halophila]
MNSGSLPLAGLTTLAWGLVYLFTQIVADPPLTVGPTVLLGIGLTVVLTLGYPSALRGARTAPTTRTTRMPRLNRFARTARTAGATARQPGRHGSTIAAVGRSIPLRSGLNAEAAERTAKLLHPLLGGDAVAITDHEKVLAFVGPGSDHHTVGDPPQTESSARVLAGGKTVVVRKRSKLGCPNTDCPLQAAVIAPLTDGKRVVGTLKVYRLDEIPPQRSLVEGLAGILSLHLELAEFDRERNLAVDAKLDALRAQINPHFLFNTLNTITSKARTDPEEARQLLLRLSDFFRYAVRQDGHFAEFSHEYFFVRTYLSLEQARYGERLRVRYDVDPQVLTAHVPVLTIQPLVENAVKHGLADKVDGGTITLKARVDPLTRTTSIRVADDGVGIHSDVLEQLTSPAGGVDGGLGLRNISERLAALYGERYRLDIRSDEGEGTVVDLRIPLG